MRRKLPSGNISPDRAVGDGDLAPIVDVQAPTRVAGRIADDVAFLDRHLGTHSRLYPGSIWGRILADGSGSDHRSAAVGRG